MLHSTRHSYTIPELQEEMEILRRSFSVVRLVSPGDCRVWRIEGDRLVDDSCPCYSVWKQTERCLCCHSEQAVQACACGSAVRFLEGRPCALTTRHVCVDGRDLALELIVEVTDESSLVHQDVSSRIEALQNEITRLMQDPLTGCATRHNLKSLFERYLSEALKWGRELCLAVLDLDDFKGINDEFGHSVGDEVLQSFSHYWLKYFGGQHQSCLVRYGGDEFVITAVSGTYESFCTRLCSLAASMRKNVVLDDARVISFSFSVGTSSLREVHPDHHPDSGKETTLLLRDLFGLADKRMYQAKKTGKNQVVTEGFPEHGPHAPLRL